VEKYWRPALIAGTVGGLVSSIPVINFANCCCLWIVLTVIWAAYMYKKDNGYVDIGPGAALGAITGGIAGFVSGFLSLGFQAIFGLQDFYRSMIMNMYGRMGVPTEDIPTEQLMSTGASVLNAIVGIVVFIFVGALVGLIMGAIWQKPKTPPAPSGSVIDAEATVEESHFENSQE